jgi:hypothetical protein
MKNRYTSYVSASILAILITAGLANAQNTITVSGAGTSAVNGTYTYAGTLNSRPYYTYGVYTTKLKVFNTMGAEVTTLINKKLEAGNYSVLFDGASLPAGVYHYTLQYGKEKLSGTMLLK